MSLARTICSLEDLIDQGIRLISVDVFDTLLYRTSKPELQRFHEISQEQLAPISCAIPSGVSATDIFNLRVQALRTVYSTKTPRFGAREGAWHEIFQLILSSLELRDKDRWRVLAECEQIELEYEARHLALNKVLADCLEKARGQSVKIICVSDMYLNQRQISRLISMVAGRDLGYAIYSSADFGYGKACGQLFRKLADDHNLEFREIAHLGDNILGDFKIPASMGLQAFHTPRSWTWRLTHGARRWGFARMNAFHG